MFSTKLEDGSIKKEEEEKKKYKPFLIVSS